MIRKRRRSTYTDDAVDPAWFFLREVLTSKTKVVDEMLGSLSVKTLVVVKHVGIQGVYEIRMRYVVRNHVRVVIWFQTYECPDQAVRPSAVTVGIDCPRQDLSDEQSDQHRNDVEY